MVSVMNRQGGLSTSLIMIAATILALSSQGAYGRDKKPTKEERRVEQMRVNLQSRSPVEYCEAVYTFRSNGFYPYCSPVTYPETQHSFTALAGAQAQKSTIVEMRMEGDRVISSKATALEKKLIDDVATTTAPSGQPCLSQSPANCIAYLAAHFLVTTAADIPFYDWSSQASFDPDKARKKRLTIQVLVPHTDSASYVKDYGWRDTSPPLDVVGVSAYVVDGRIEAVTLSGRYPILSENPTDYSGSGFAAFVKALFPSCQFANDDEFYRSFWTALVKPQQFSESSGKWRATSNGISKSYSSSADGQICGLKVDAYSSTGRSITDSGQSLSGSTKQVTFRLPKIVGNK